MNRYKLDLDLRRGYLYVRVAASSIDRETALDYLRKVAGVCERAGCRRVLIERDIPAMLSNGDLFFTILDFKDMMCDVRVAFVNPHEPIEDDLAFAMSVASNRGGKFKVFRDVPEAEKWLSSAF